MVVLNAIILTYHISALSSILIAKIVTPVRGDIQNVPFYSNATKKLPHIMKELQVPLVRIELTFAGYESAVLAVER